MDRTDIAQRRPAVAARERIVSTAYALFTRRGVRAVGIDEIISQSGVASDQAIRQVQEHLRVAADHRGPARAGLAGEQEHRRQADGRAGFGGSAHAQAARYDSTRHIGAQGA